MKTLLIPVTALLLSSGAYANPLDSHPESNNNLTSADRNGSQITANDFYNGFEQSSDELNRGWGQPQVMATASVPGIGSNNQSHGSMRRSVDIYNGFEISDVQ